MCQCAIEMPPGFVPMVRELKCPARSDPPAEPLNRPPLGRPLHGPINFRSKFIFLTAGEVAGSLASSIRLERLFFDTDFGIDRDGKADAKHIPAAEHSFEVIIDLTVSGFMTDANPIVGQPHTAGITIFSALRLAAKGEIVIFEFLA